MKTADQKEKKESSSLWKKKKDGRHSHSLPCPSGHVGSCLPKAKDAQPYWPYRRRTQTLAGSQTKWRWLWPGEDRCHPLAVFIDIALQGQRIASLAIEYSSSSSSFSSSTVSPFFHSMIQDREKNSIFFSYAPFLSGANLYFCRFVFTKSSRAAAAFSSSGCCLSLQIYSLKSPFLFFFSLLCAFFMVHYLLLYCTVLPCPFLLFGFILPSFFLFSIFRLSK